MEDALAIDEPAESSKAASSRVSNHSKLTSIDGSRRRAMDRDSTERNNIAQDLTSFNDWTEPPKSTSPPNDKNALETGLSGLYSKFKATIGGQKESETVKNGTVAVSVTSLLEQDQSLATSTTTTSRIQSPILAAADSNGKLEIALPISSSKTLKMALPSPGVRSPNAAPFPSVLAEPALTTFQATMKNQTHSRAGSSHDQQETTRKDPTSNVLEDTVSLKRVSSRTDTDGGNARHERQISQGGLRRVDTKISGHVRDASDMSSKQRNVDKTAPTSQNASREDPLRTAAPAVSNVFHESRPMTNPLELLAASRDHDTIEDQHKDDTVSAKIDSHKHGRSRSRTTANRPTQKISHSKLPGFQASRTSSTDSAVTSGILGSPKQRGVQFDERDPIHPPGPSLAGLKSAGSKVTGRRSRLLAKEFWMRDENARDCFTCSEPFTMMRRKHHCRTCGQIFDNKCTSLISGSHFDMPHAIRVCKPCELTITLQDDDDSSVHTEDDITPYDTSVRPFTPDFSAARYDDDNMSLVSQSIDHRTRTPNMAFPARRGYEKGNRSSAILEFDDAPHILPRPSSSRSLRTTHQIGHGHKRHHSKHNHIRSTKHYHEDKVPFQRQTLEDVKAQNSSAFHRDSIIDPELAQYLSDDASSDEEPQLHLSHSSEKLSRSGPDSDRTTIGGLLAAVRKGRTRIGDRSIASFLNFGSKDADDAASIVSARAIEGVKSARRRNHSVASSVYHKTTPRTTRDRLQLFLPDANELDTPESPVIRTGRMMRSSSMHGLGAPQLELNRASLQHVHKMLRQLLKDAKVSRVSHWEHALVPILLKVTDDVDPDVRGGDDIDIRSYVKLKKVPGGRPADTAYVSGLVFTKNVALKSMQRSILHPRILLVTFAIEYTKSDAHVMSLDPILRQEREYLQKVVSRIAALKPDVLLAQRNVSGLALDLLDRAGIAVAFNVKLAVLEAVSRCTQAGVYHTIDRLNPATAYLGMCDSFDVKTVLSDGRRKTFIYLSGCPPELGCTIALRGAGQHVLEKIKKIADFMIYVVYNLKLETCLMRDEWALIPSTDVPVRTSTTTPEVTQLQQAIAEQEHIQEKQHQPTQNKSEMPLDENGERSETKRTASTESDEIPSDIPVPTFYQDLADQHQTRILSASPFVKFSQPHLLMRAREMERKVAYLKSLRDKDLSDNASVDEKAKPHKFTLITPEMVHDPPSGASRKVKEIIHAVHDAEYEKALYYYETQKRGWESHLAENKNLFDPYAHQSIVLLFSSVSTDTSVPCIGPETIAFNFYNEHELGEGLEADATLGQYVEDMCHRANDPCSLPVCDKRSHEHQRQYVHGEARVTFFIEPYPPKLRGLQDVILMWSVCKICSTETTVTPMSPSTWKYSFGKYLELSFWSADLHARAGGCPHDLHRDHLRYFGYRGYAIRIHYDPIDLLEVVTPRMRITWKIDSDLIFRNDMYSRLEHRITRFMVSVKLRLKSINVDALMPDSAEACGAQIERLMKKANEDHSSLVKRLQELYNNSPYWQVTPLNRAMHALQVVVVEWEEAFIQFERDHFPSEKDIRRLATLQLKKLFIDRDASVTTLHSDDTSVQDVNTMDEQEKDIVRDGAPLISPCPEKTSDILQAVVDEDNASPSKDAIVEVETLQPGILDSVAADTPGPFTTEKPKEPLQTSADLSHLDLAVSAVVPSIDPMEAVHDTTVTQRPDLSEHTTSADVIETDMQSSNIVTNEERRKESSAERISGPVPDTTLPFPSQIPLIISARPGPLHRPPSPLLSRSRSHPAGSLPVRNTFSKLPKQSTMSAIHASKGFGSNHSQAAIERPRGKISVIDKQRFLTSRELSVAAPSLIPRAVSATGSRVSYLARHFEALAREFEVARINQKRRRRAQKTSNVPGSAPRGTVDLYDNVHDAVDGDAFSERTHQSEEVSDSSGSYNEETDVVTDCQPENQILQETTPIPKIEHEERETPEASDTAEQSHPQSEIDEKTDGEDGNMQDEGVSDSEEISVLPDSAEDLARLSQDDTGFSHLPKHERKSLVKLLTNFWAERSSSGWAPLDYPLALSDHIYTDSDIIIREDELSSIIAFTLSTDDYMNQLRELAARSKRITKPNTSQDPKMDEDIISQGLLCGTQDHIRYEVAVGPVKVLCKIFFCQQFNAMRQKCGVAERFVESMSRCMKFDSRGGKSKSLFLKTLDDRFVIKSLSPVETQSFVKFAPKYFDVISETFYHELPSCIAKMLGLFNIVMKNPVTGIEHNFFLLVMENLFYDRSPDHIFDLKGSMRNRKVMATGERNEVLLDENMVDFVWTSPLFVREHSDRILRSSVFNDSLWLSRVDVMDYSLMVAIEEKRKELVVGIIDCIRTYTWDKKLESWIKDRGFLNAVMGAGVVAGMGAAVSGGKNKPTITSPRDYKRRFRQAMKQYVLLAPSCWHQFASSRTHVPPQTRLLNDDEDAAEDIS